MASIAEIRDIRAGDINRARQLDFPRRQVTLAELADPRLPHIVNSLVELVSPGTDWIASWRRGITGSANRKSILHDLGTPSLLSAPAPGTRR